MIRWSSSVGLAGAVLVSVACVHSASVGALASRCASETLLFGRNIPGGGKPDSAHVSAEQWREYADEVLARSIPGGSTTMDAEGRYLDGGHPAAESTKVVVVVHATSAAAEAGVDSAIAIYLRRFKQQSVGRVTVPASSGLCR